MIAGRVLVTLLREVLRALAFPVWLLLHLPVRGRWRSRARAALAAPLPALEDVAVPVALQPEAHVFLSAGEASGLRLAEGLMAALHDQGVKLRWSCFGGPSMAAAGGTLLYPLADLAVMGVLPVLGSIGDICRAYARYERLLRDDPPDLVVLVDYPGFHLVLAEAARRRGVPVLHYVAPQYWAWAPWRVRRYRRCVDRTLCVLPFEVPFFRELGIRGRYIGHPLLDQPELAPEPGDPLSPGRPILCLLPGSRSKEIRLNLPGMLEVAAALRREVADLRVVLPHRDPARAAMVREMLAERRVDFVELQVGAPTRWFAIARVVLAKSGTGSLEACLQGTPTVVVYQMRGIIPLLFSSQLLSIPWFGIPNLIAGRRIVPEFAFTDDRRWQRITDAVRELWADGPARERCRADLRELRERLGGPGASQRAAHAVRAFLAEIAAGGHR